jgi:hypothetical protein
MDNAGIKPQLSADQRGKSMCFAAKDWLHGRVAKLLLVRWKSW